MSDGSPEQKARWFYAIEERWQTFTDEDDEALEERWRQLTRQDMLKKRRQELEEDKKKQQQAIEGESSSSKLPSKQGPPSGVDQVGKGVIDALGKGTQDEEQAKNKDEDLVIDEQLDPDEPEENRRFKVEVMEDHLFEVDIGTMQLYPVFWKGVLLKVVRATWFYASKGSKGHTPIPYDEGLSSDLDAAYDKAKPRRKPVIEDKDKEEKEGPLYELPSMNDKGKVQFENGNTGRIFTEDFTGKAISLFGGSIVIRGWEESARHSLVSQYTMPWASGKEQEDEEANEAQDSKSKQNKEGAAKVPSKAPATTSSSNRQSEASGSKGGLLRLWPSSDVVLRPGVNLLRAIGWSKEDANAEKQREAKQKNTEKSLENEDDSASKEQDDCIPNDRKDDPPELILAIHGIGQAMVDEWDAIDFVYDVEKLRNLSHKVAKEMSMRKVSRGKRVQFLPICWRKKLNFDEEEAREGNDNIYTLQDVSNSASIPIIRSIVSKVILDVPYYLSRHKVKMIEAVRAELNRVYRLFVRRNPRFEELGGRVSLICHSLGSAIAADILSEQPTHVGPLRDQTAEDMRSNKHLLFNVKNLFFIGSPNGFFFHLEGAQMIARRGASARTKEAAPDAVSDEIGRYGCMAAEAVYNCYNSTDPVAFQLSATVDVEYARMLHPISIPDAVPALLEALALPRLHLSKLFDPIHPFSSPQTRKIPPAYKMETKSKSIPNSTVNSGVNTPKEAEERSTIIIEQGSLQKQSQIQSKVQESGGNKRDQPKKSTSEHFQRLERAERRFRALNPHGCIDFIYDSGGYNQYFDMLSAHISYWQSSSFATFVLLQLFTDFDKEDEVPTIVPNLDPEQFLRAKGKPSPGDDATQGQEAEDDDSSSTDVEEGSALSRLYAAISPSTIM